jgi:uncharacterized linocin/CFP29 family protein
MERAVNNLNREKLESWENTNIWKDIDSAVHDESARAKVVPKVIPLYGPLANPWQRTISADQITKKPETITVDEVAEVPLVEVAQTFELSPAQVEEEGDQLSTAVTLATRAANLLARGVDILILQGDPAKLPQNVKIVQGKAPAPALVEAAARSRQVFPVDRDPNTNEPIYGEGTFAAVAAGYSELEGDGYVGPFALLLPPKIYADTFRPLKETLQTPGDRIMPLVPHGFTGTSSLPDSEGLLMSVGGNVLDLVIGIDAITAFVQGTGESQYLFRVLQRFALRIKDNAALFRLEFQPNVP